MTHAAVVTRGAAFVHARQDRGAPDGHDAIVEVFGDCVAHILLDARHFHGRQKLAVGKLRQTFSLTADASELFDVVVPRRDVRVANGPIDSDALFQVGLEVQIAPAIALAPPKKRFTADLTPANPGKMLAGIGGIWILDIVHKEFAGILVASVITLALDVLDALALRAFVPPAILKLPNGNVLDVIALGNDAAARLKH